MSWTFLLKVWPLFRCSRMAAFGCSLRYSVLCEDEQNTPTMLRLRLFGSLTTSGRPPTGRARRGGEEEDEGNVRDDVGPARILLYQKNIEARSKPT